MFQKILIRSFRNISDSTLTLNPSLNIFVGSNGQGKSNFLEALCVLSIGQSFRYSDNENLIQFKKSESLLKAKVLQGDLDFEIQINISKSRKSILLQNKKISSLALSKQFPIVIFSPESLASIKDGADQRRQLIDEALGTFGDRNLDLIADFKKCLKMRNKLLKDSQDETKSKNETLAVLESLEPQFLALSTQLTVQRIKALNHLLPEINNAMQNISKFGQHNSNVDISVEYVASEQNLIKLDSDEIERIFKKRLLELRAAELASGSSLVGPHKHDIKFLYNQNDSRFYCSQGQQRALILSFKMAQIVYHGRAHGAYPVLMLDDVLSELDSEKRRALISFLSEIETQIFITTTDFNLSEDFSAISSYGKCSVFRISGGNVHDE